MPEVITNNLDLWLSALLTKSTAGRGSKGKLEAYGIKKLRELILELAVRGKLVPQDANDEPASLLLKKIEEKTKRLMVEGKIRKSNPTPQIKREDMPYELPKSWVWARLGNIGVIGSSSRVHQKDWKDSGVPFYRAREIVQLSKYGSVDNELFITEEHFQSLATSGTTPEPGDVMLTGVGTIGVPYVVRASDRFYFKDASVLIFKNYFNIFPLFLRYLFESQYWINDIHKGSMGTTVHTLTISRANEVLIPLPPEAEQRRIVTKVDELMALCDQLEQQQTHSIEAHQTLVETLLGTLTCVESQQEFSAAWARIANHFDTLFSTEASIDQLKQSILQLAVMGKLVPQDPNAEPASVLLRQCVERRSLLIEQGKVRAEKPLPEINNDEKEWELPCGWVWERLGNIFSGGSGTTPLRSNANYFINGTENWFKTTDLNLAVVMEGEEKVTKQAVEECNLTYYPPKTVCIAMYGGAGTIGKSGVLGVESTINQSVFALPPVEQILPEYLHIFVKTARDKWMQYAAGLRKDPNINGLIIKKMVMPVPPKEEQHRIVAKVDELMVLCDTLKARLADAQTIQLHLADAIVEQAVA